MSRERQLTADGFELDFGTNSSVTTRSPDGCSTVSTPVGRIVTVTSAVHRKGSIDFDDLPMERGYSVPAAYARSKLAELMFSIELQRRLAADGMAGASLASHPGRATAESCVSRTRS